MREERRRILEMLEAGKVSVDEAARLLESLGKGAMAEWMPERWVQAVTQAVDRVGARVRSPVEHRVEELTGDLVAEQGGVELDVEFATESLRVMSHALPGWRLVLAKDGLAGADGIGHYRVESGPGRLWIRREDAPRGPFGPLAAMGMRRITLYLPQDVAVRGRVRLSNGALRVTGLRVDGVHLETGNGRVALNAAGGRAVVEAGNGSVRVSGPLEQLHASSANGAVDVEDGGSQEASYRLRSYNGRVRALLRPQPGWSAKVEAESGVGPVHVRVPGMEVDSQRLGAGQRVRATVVGDPSPSRHLVLVAVTGNGRVDVDAIEPHMGAVTVEGA